MKKQNKWFILVTLLTMLFLVAACAGGATPTQAPAEEPAAEEPMAEEPAAEEPAAEEPMAEEPMAEEPMAEATFPMPPGGFLEKAVAGEYAGTTVVVDGPFTDVD
ncbi:MAG: hypothetical protein JXM69_14930, partial [Anaerolineae bacterium]|nr:hypothetical protein [Anaerolineae bacterium]